MTIQDCGDVPSSSTLVTGSNGNSLDSGSQIISEEGHVPKIRKPYTITKQRERWTEEDHKRFLEALKLYGRAWRKIEEHVGTKTAVQIRSHAQKFFSKVVRESSNSNSVESVEIPPPRPKRKPVYPYPRNLVLPAKKGKPSSSDSPLDQENQSPTFVLSAVASNVLGSEDSNTPYGSSENASSESDEPVSMKLKRLPEHDAFNKEGSSESSTSTKSFRLFGKTLSVIDVEKPFISSTSSSNPKSRDTSEGLAPEIAGFAVANARFHPVEVACYGGMQLPFSLIPVDIANVTMPCFYSFTSHHK